MKEPSKLFRFITKADYLLWGSWIRTKYLYTKANEMFRQHQIIGTIVILIIMRMAANEL